MGTGVDVLALMGFEARRLPPDFFESQVQDQVDHLSLNSVCGARFGTHWRLEFVF